MLLLPASKQLLWVEVILWYDKVQQSGCENSISFHTVTLILNFIQGSPVAALLKAADATVTICHSKTSNMEEIVSSVSLSFVIIAKLTAVMMGSLLHRSRQRTFWWWRLAKQSLSREHGSSLVLWSLMLAQTLFLVRVDAIV